VTPTNGGPRRACCSLLILGALLLASLPSSRGAETGRGPGLRLLDNSLRVGVRVSVKGKLVDGAFLADDVELQKSNDQDEELQGPITDLDRETGTFRLVGRLVRVDSKSRYTREPDEAAGIDDLHDGLQVKIDGETGDDGVLLLDKLRIQYKQQSERRKLEGPIESLEASDEHLAVMRVAGVEVLLTLTTDLTGRRGQYRPIVTRLGGVADDNELLFVRNTRIGRHIAFAGEVRLRAESLPNFDLDPSEDKDTLVPEFAAQIGFAAALGPGYGYLTLVGAREFVIGSEQPFEEGASMARIGEAYFQFPLSRNLAVAFGRQRYNDERDWYYATRQLDAVRLFASAYPFVGQISISRDLFDESRNVRDQDLRNIILEGGYHVSRDVELIGYIVDRKDLTDLNDSPRTAGLRLIGDPGRHVEFWLDLAYQGGTACSRVDTILVPDGNGNEIERTFDTGRRCSHADPPAEFSVRDVRAHAIDFGVSYRPRWKLDPTLTVGYASGSGESDEIRELPVAETQARTSTSFRQTGLQRNRWRFNGVVSFRYYGEVLDPELFNLKVLTVDLGFRPLRRGSIDVIYHDFRQDEASRSFYEFDIDDNPSGLDADIGRELDLALGYEPGRQYELRLTAGRFWPGAAFGEDATPANAVRFQAKFRF